MPSAWATSPLESLVVARRYSPGLQVAVPAVRASGDPITAHGGDPENSLLRRSSHGPLSMEDRKSTRLNSSHVAISYAVFCLKKKKHKKLLDIRSCLNM